MDTLMTLQLQVDQLIAAGELKLQLGCGANILPGWINTDNQPSVRADYLDFTQQFPFVSNMMAAVFCEHTIEHITSAEAVRMVGEVFRVLKPGGWFRVVTPSLDRICQMLLDPDSAPTRIYVDWARRFMNKPNATITDAMNLVFYGHGHRHIYSAEELLALLRQAGFSDLRSMPGGQYANPIFNGVDGHGKIMGEEANSVETMAIEARKPPGSS
jgi:predicted SAM-dependent methyltransferase